MQLTIASAEFLLLKEQGVIHQRQGVEDIELEALGEDESVVDEFVKALLEISPVDLFLQSNFRGVVK